LDLLNKTFPNTRNRR